MPSQRGLALHSSSRACSRSAAVCWFCVMSFSSGSPMVFRCSSAWTPLFAIRKGFARDFCWKDLLFFRYSQKVTTPTWNRPAAGGAATDLDAELDAIALGRRIRHLRKAKALTLDGLGEVVGIAPSQLSLIENGKREPKVSLLKLLAAALDTGVDDLLGAEPPNR